jgi:hypothetical protein
MNAALMSEAMTPTTGGLLRLLAITFAFLTLFILTVSAKAVRQTPRPPAAIARALWRAHVAYGVPYREMVAVAWCESRFDPNAVGDGSHGLFQFLRGTWNRTPYAGRDIYSALDNSLAAGWLWRRDGGSWREWSCGRLNGLR